MFDANNTVVLTAEAPLDAESIEETGTDVTSTVQEEVEITEALALSGLGFGIVFAVLVVLMAFITVMSAVIRGGKKEEKPAKKAEVKKEAPAPVKEAAPVSAPVKGDADMYVSLNGKKHAVSVEEKLPRFTVTLNGKTHGVDVESVEEE
ncbi:MAG: hypothetical protein E7597_05735 [Ruminococcaceae bacterium]|nr:hypothetical protein [Oscillospiraceae bacterium]